MDSGQDSGQTVENLLEFAEDGAALQLSTDSKKKRLH